MQQETSPSQAGSGCILVLIVVLTALVIGSCAGCWIYYRWDITPAGGVPEEEASLEVVSTSDPAA